MLITRKKNDGLVIHVGNQEVTVSVRDVGADDVSLAVESSSALKDVSPNGNASPAPRDDDKTVTLQVSHIDYEDNEKPNFKHIVMTPESDERVEDEEPTASESSSLWAFLRGMGSVMEIWPTPERFDRWRKKERVPKSEWAEFVRDFWEAARDEETNQELRARLTAMTQRSNSNPQQDPEIAP